MEVLPSPKTSTRNALAFFWYSFFDVNLLQYNGAVRQRHQYSVHATTIRFPLPTISQIHTFAQISRHVATLPLLFRIPQKIQYRLHFRIVGFRLQMNPQFLKRKQNPNDTPCHANPCIVQNQNQVRQGKHERPGDLVSVRVK